MSYNEVNWGYVFPVKKDAVELMDEDSLIDLGIFQTKNPTQWWKVHVEGSGRDEGFCDMKFDPDKGWYSFKSLHYNGGAGLVEVLQDAMEGERRE
jgi:hypothetical protein